MTTPAVPQAQVTYRIPLALAERLTQASVTMRTSKRQLLIKALEAYLPHGLAVDSWTDGLRATGMGQER